MKWVISCLLCLVAQTAFAQFYSHTISSRGATFTQGYYIASEQRQSDGTVAATVTVFNYDGTPQRSLGFMEVWSITCRGAPPYNVSTSTFRNISRDIQPNAPGSDWMDTMLLALWRKVCPKYEQIAQAEKPTQSQRTASQTVTARPTPPPVRLPPRQEPTFSISQYITDHSGISTLSLAVFSLIGLLTGAAALILFLDKRGDAKLSNEAPFNPQALPARVTPFGAPLVAVPSTVAPVSITVEDVHILLRRSQRMGGVFGNRVIFQVNARTELTPEQLSLVQRYRLGKEVVYDSLNRRKHTEAFIGKPETNGIGLLLGAINPIATTWRILKKTYHYIRAATSLRITIASLQRGHTLRCRDLNELVGAEAAIREACKTMKQYLELAQTFDGREEIIRV